MNIIGQDKIINFIDKRNIDTLPRTLMLEGKEGSGRHSICNYISNKYNIYTQDITSLLSFDLLEDIYGRVEPYLYIIDADSITLKQENVILKFLEEPLKNSFIVVLTQNRYNIIETVRNRCFLISLKPYSRDILSSFIKNKENENILLTICETPGDLIKMESYAIKDMLDLCIKILENINKASIPNSLSLVKYLSFKDEKDKYDFNIFMKALRYIAKKRVEYDEENCFNQYLIINEYINRSKVKNVDKKYLFEDLLLSLKGVNN